MCIYNTVHTSYHCFPFWLECVNTETVQTFNNSDIIQTRSAISHLTDGCTAAWFPPSETVVTLRMTTGGHYTATSESDYVNRVVRTGPLHHARVTANDRGEVAIVDGEEGVPRKKAEGDRETKEGEE